MIAEIVGQIPMFADIPIETLTKFYTENLIRIQRFFKGATVHQRHERCTAVDFVVSGTLTAYTLAENGSAMRMFTFQKGGMIGANLLFGDFNEYPLNIYCMSKCTLLQLDRTVISELLYDHRFADFLGVQRPSLFRELKKLKDEGLLEINNREITLRTEFEHTENKML